MILNALCRKLEPQPGTRTVPSEEAMTRFK